MEKDFINGTFLRLTEECRIRDAVDFCQRIIDETDIVEYKCLALRNLAECHFFKTGDGEACRQANLKGLELLEANPELLNGTMYLSEKHMKRLYSDFCEQFRNVAISFDEYEEYIEKPLRVRGRNAAEERGLRVVADLKSKNLRWIENLFGLVENYYPQNAMGSRKDGLGQAVCLLSLILKNRRSMRAKALDINFGIQMLSNASCDLVMYQIKQCEQKKLPIQAENSIFILENAKALIEEMRDERLSDERTIEMCLASIAKVKDHLLSLDDPEANPNNYLTMDEIDKTFDERLDELHNTRLTSIDNGINSTGDEKGCLIKLMLSILMLAAVVYAWVVTVQQGGIANYFFISLATVGGLGIVLRYLLTGR